MAYNSFPYTNYHELNLDYLLNKSKEIEGNVQETADNVLRATQQADRSTQQAVNSQNSATASAQSAAASSQSAVNSANSATASAQSAEEARAAAGDPKTFTAATQLTDTTKIYVYVGETGTYTYGHYYYYQGGSWHDGGVYGTWATDDALSDTSTNAVQNKVVTGAVNSLKSDLNGLTQVKTVPFSSNEGYINTSVSVGDTVNITPVTGVGFNYIIEPCNAGDIFTLTAKGGGNARAWAFTDRDYKLISKSAPSITVTDLVLTAESSGYFIANNTQSYANPSCTKKAVITIGDIEQIAENTVDTATAEMPTVTEIYDGFVFEPSAWGVGSYTQTIGSESVPFANNARRHTPVLNYSFPVKLSSDGAYKYTVLFLDDENILLSKYTEMTSVFNVPANTLFRVIIQDASDGTTDISGIEDSVINSHVVIYNDELAEIVNPKNPLKWCAMGDSITEGYYSYINSQNVGAYAVDTLNTWVPIVSRMNKWDVTNIGIGGTGFLKPVNNAQDDHTTGYYVARNTDFSNYELITLAYGINDWKANELMGDITDDASVTTPTTVIQAMKATIEAILASNPNCKIIGILPLNCAGYNKDYGSKATNWGLGYAFSNSGTLEQFVNVLISVYNYYGIQYIDMAHYSCVNRENLLSALPDGVHPSLIIHGIMAHELSKKITY